MTNHRHQWQPTGGCAENPGVYDSGSGGIIEVAVCTVCGMVRRIGYDYTRVRPGNTWGPLYKLADGTPCGRDGRRSPAD